MLRLVANKNEISATVVELEQARISASLSQILEVEAVAIRKQHGPNPYSDFLTTHGRRPDGIEAETIGRLMGARVRASDGRLLPALSKPERLARAASNAEKRTQARKTSELLRLRQAIATLAENQSYLVEMSSDSFGGVAPALTLAELQTAQAQLNRITQEFSSREPSQS